MLLLALWSADLAAAQVRGTVVREGAPAGPVSVALFPLGGQALPAPRARDHRIALDERRFQPSYVVARVGDSLLLVNHDAVHHVITAPYAPQLLQVALSGAGTADAQASVRFTKPGTWYLFCRIHPSRYARVDVLSTPLATMAGADGSFSFDDVPPGRWRLRAAARGAEAVSQDLDAFTAPPPVRIVLPARPAAAAGRDGERVEDLFPSPGDGG